MVGQYNSTLACFHLVMHVVKGCSTCITRYKNIENVML